MANWDQVEGEGKEKLGEVTGDDSMEREGKTQEAWGDTKEKTGDAWDDAKDKADDAADEVRDRI